MPISRRLRFVGSETQSECGAACLAMILSHYDCHVSLGTCRSVAKVGRDGATTKNLVLAARSFGLEADALQSSLDGLTTLPLPVVLHWEFQHFVVLEAMRADGTALIADPAVGRRAVPVEELDRAFTGVVVSARPGPHFRRLRQPRSSPWRRLGQLVLATRKAKALMAQILAVSVVMVAVGLVGPLLTKTVVDELLPRQLSELLPVLALGGALTVLTAFLSEYLRSLLVVQLASRVDASLMREFFAHLLGLSYDFFQQRTIGDLVQRLSSNAQIRQALAQQSVGAVLESGLVLVYGVIIFRIDAVFGTAALGIGLLQAAVVVGASRRVTRLTIEELKEVGRTQAFAIEALSAIDTVKASGGEKHVNKQFTKLLADQLNASMARNRFVSLLGSATSGIVFATPLTLTWLGASQVLSGAMTLGTMFGLIALSLQFVAPMTRLVVAMQQLQTVQGHAARLAAVFDEEPEPVGNGRTLADIDGVIEFDDVGFRYDAASPWTLRHIDLVIHPGQRVAVVGRSGSGKSTLGRLAVGLQTPTEGAIRVDGHDLRDVDRASVRRRFGVVMQQPAIFSGSIRDNITLLDDDISLTEVEAAAKMAALDEDVAQMNLGYDTQVSSTGSSLSGGQKQRISLARAICRRPRLLILDEATSSLDAITESRVLDGLRERRCSTLIIAHRLSTIRSADVIVVIGDGAIVERGTHADLLAQHGLYAELVAQQMAMEHGVIDHGVPSQR